MDPIDPATWLNDIITRLLNLVVWPLFTGLVIIMFIWAGFLFLTGRGDPTKTETARKAVIWAVAGIIVAIIGFSAYAFIKNILGV